ncbi:hypothetical protein UM181_02470 [Alphaproteobacteria bacterium US3C007]|nr:hypothetical protein UM181_02470 [Alphaproteobacteria bacterium US3C007]
MRNILFIAILLFVNACKVTDDLDQISSSKINAVVLQNQFVPPVENIFKSKRIQRILDQRKTINPFLAWDNKYGLTTGTTKYGDNFEYYGMHWSAGNGDRFRVNNRLELKTPNWNYFYPGKEWNYWSNQEDQMRFVTDQNWDHADEYGATKVMNIAHKDFPNSFASEVRNETKNGFHGVMLDWWHNGHPTKWKGRELDGALINIASAIRREMGDGFLIMGNVNYEMNEPVIKELNGVYLELYKDSKDSYTRHDILRIQDIIDFYNQKLKSPKIIALDAWRLTNASIPTNLRDPNILTQVNSDRNSLQNRRLARLFSAMSAVSADTGYILYGDNNADFEFGDHDHFYYDIYRLNLGQPVSQFVEPLKGLRVKKFKRGYIAYNLNKTPVNLQISDFEVTVGSMDAVYISLIGESLI